MKIIGTMFLIVAMSILLLGGISALQAQSDAGDSVINESSDNYQTYNEVKNMTSLSMQTAGYGVYMLVILLLAVFASIMLAAVAVIRK